ncbi:glycosyltransferase [Mycolicibacterium mengxianglii]|uniref:glycosyltransferase n=1 Tax=Mycolicibacterium mengxianglii TaxID=2736649 RepID=UPI0018EEEC99|nr:glycosyltransferase [Mycolicibacterium mengxianglii]
MRDADLVVSLTPQSDMALATTSLRWVAYLRGLPWPSAGEASALRTVAWRNLERLALRRALETWSTTTILVEEARIANCRLVPPGIRAPADSSKPSGVGQEFVWAARYSEDKNPGLFLNVMAKSGAHGVMYGTGPLEEKLRLSAPSNVNVAGWRNKADLWREARAYVGTSFREAFGRSAVEAAMLGLPVVLSDRFGCAPMLYTDPALACRFVLPTDAPSRWLSAIDDLDSDESLRKEAAAHVSANARGLTIESAVRNVQNASAAACRTLSS